MKKETKGFIIAIFLAPVIAVAIYMAAPFIDKYIGLKSLVYIAFVLVTVALIFILVKLYKKKYIYIIGLCSIIAISLLYIFTNINVLIIISATLSIRLAHSWYLHKWRKTRKEERDATTNEMNSEQ